MSAGSDKLFKETSRLQQIHPSGIRKMFQRAQGLEGVISLGIGAPDLMPPQGLLEKVKDNLSNFRAHTYTLNSGIPPLREKITQKYREEYSLDYDKDGVVVTAGGTQFLFTSIFALTDPGDEIIVPDPGFVYYPTIPLIAGLKVIPIPLDDKFQMDPELVKEAISDKTRLIITNSPSNPTGGMFTEETVKGISDVAVDHDVAILSDEVYEYITFDGKQHIPMATHAPENTITLNAFSKTYCVPGWRMGYGVGPKKLMSPIAKLHPFVIANPPSLFQYAISEFMGSHEDLTFRESMRSDMEKRAKVIQNSFSKIDGVTVPKIEGSFYAFPSIDRQGSNPGEDFVEEVFTKAKVVMVPASEFGETRKKHFRISFGSASTDHLEESVIRIKENLNL